VSERDGFRLRDWLLVLLLLLTSLVSITDRFAMSLLLEPIKAQLRLSDGELGLLTGAAFGMFYALISLPMGWLSDRWSRKGVILIGIGVWTAATAACGLVANAVQFAIARMVVGVGEAGLAPASYSLIHDRFPRRLLGRAMSVYQVGGMVGAGVAMYVAGTTYSYFLAHKSTGVPLIGGLQPWQQTFVAICALSLPLMGLLAFIREPRDSAQRLSSGASAAALVRALRDDAFFYGTLFCGISLILLVTLALLAWLPSIIVREYGWAPKRIGEVYGGLVAVSSVIGLLSGGALADGFYRRGRLDAPVALSLGAAIASLCLIIVLGTVSSAVAVLLVAGALHLAMGIPIGIIPAYIQTRSASQVRGQISAIYVLAVNFFGLGVGPTLVGYASAWLAGRFGGLRTAVCAVSAGSLLVSIVLLTLLWLSRHTTRIPITASLAASSIGP
jgi:predicted MFS family arabinose efflux permease